MDILNDLDPITFLVLMALLIVVLSALTNGVV